ncbi:FecR domain-containing protein [Methylophaga thalassica]|uniref:FecR domain-containing protein n=1 Tax=Methylophaga thalassica TaxID=40223 RepID=UPI002E7C4FDA|nr:FecR domain-containing protein [Methylophaga thalassica]WVI85417.1 FecR domain-containing protein [Methylophaga thalassica]
MSASPYPSSDIIETAASWMARLWAEDASPEDKQACEYWRQQSPEHEQAWQVLISMSERFERLPKNAANSALLTSKQNSRRQFLQWVGIFIGSASVGFGIHKTDVWQQAMSDYSTGIGETREVHLSDGSHLQLNTDTAIDVVFNGKQRLIHLNQGEVFISTGHAAEFVNQPFIVMTAQGQIEALGTQFNVRQNANVTEVTVIQDRVLIHHAQQQLTLNAGERIRFNEHQLTETVTADPTITSWRQHKLVAEQMPVSQFINELSRYRSGILRCDDAVADLKVSGVFPLNDTDKALQQMAQALPVSIHSRTRYWVTIVPRETSL